MLTVDPAVRSFPVADPTDSPGSAGEVSAVAIPVLDTWQALRRYLLVGGVVAVPARTTPIAVAGAGPVRAALATDSLRVVAEILAATVAVPSRPEPMLLALALASATDDDLTRRAALTALPRVARTSRDLFLFASFVQGLRGWGRGLRRAIGAWYNDRPAADLVEDVLATPAGAGWRHADLLRLGHPKSPTSTHDLVYRWLVTGAVSGTASPDLADPNAGRVVERLAAASRLAEVTDPEVAAELIAAHRLPAACLPPALSRTPAVWKAVLPHLPIAELLDGLPELAASGCLASDGELVATVLDRLGDGEAITTAKVPPLAFVAALRGYQSGYRDGSRWPVDPELPRSLERAFDHVCRRLATPMGPVEIELFGSLAEPWTGVGMVSPVDVVATLALVFVRAGTDVTVRGPGAMGRPPGIDAVDQLDEAVMVIGRLIPSGGNFSGTGPVVIRSTPSDSRPRVIELWPTPRPDQAAPSPDDGADRIAIHGIDPHLVGTVLNLLRESS